jgi:hypothetical protein
LLAATICGLFTAAMATWVAWQTSRPQPDRAEATAVFAALLPDHTVGDIYVPSGLFLFYGEQLSLSHVDQLLFGDGGEYQLSSTSMAQTGMPPVSPEHTLTLAQQRLGQTGWQVYPPVVRKTAECIGPPCDPDSIPTETVQVAQQGDTILALAVISGSTVDSAYLTLSLSRAAPAAVYPTGLAVGLVGGALAWLVFAWASRRTGPDSAARNAIVNAMFAVTVFFWCVPATLSTLATTMHQISQPHPAWHPLWEWLGQPTASLPFLIGSTTALTALAVAALPRRAAKPAPTAATG